MFLGELFLLLLFQNGLIHPFVDVLYKVMHDNHLQRVFTGIYINVHDSHEHATTHMCTFAIKLIQYSSSSLIVHQNDLSLNEVKF